MLILLFYFALFGTSHTPFASEPPALIGTYNRDVLLLELQRVGDATNTTDETGTVAMITGNMMSSDGSPIPYEVLVSMCEGFGTDCANISLRHDWYAESADIWCINDIWDELGDRHASPVSAFDKLRFIQDEFLYVRANGSSEADIADIWQQELLEFNQLTQNVRELCP